MNDNTEGSSKPTDQSQLDVAIHKFRLRFRMPNSKYMQFAIGTAILIVSIGYSLSLVAPNGLF